MRAIMKVKSNTIITNKIDKEAVKVKKIKTLVTTVITEMIFLKT